MAYITKSEVQKKRVIIFALCKKYGVSATVSGSNSSTLTVTIRKGWIDFLGNHVDTVESNVSQEDWVTDHAHWRKTKGFMMANPYHLNKEFSGIALDFMLELLQIMKIGHYDNSDIMTDYFDIAWYIGINVGEGQKPYTLTV